MTKKNDNVGLGVRRADFGNFASPSRLDSLSGRRPSAGGVKKTSLILPDDVYVRLKMFAASCHRTVGDLLTEAIEDFLSKNGR